MDFVVDALASLTHCVAKAFRQEAAVLLNLDLKIPLMDELKLEHITIWAAIRTQNISNALCTLSGMAIKIF